MFKVRIGISICKVSGRSATVDPEFMKDWAPVLNDFL